MTTSTDFITTFCSLSHLPRHEFDRIAMELRKRQLIPTGGRGLHAPDLKPKDAALLLTAMLAPYRPKDMMRALKAYRNLKNQDSSFLELLEKLFHDPELAYGVKSIRLSKNLARAEIVFNDGTSKVFCDDNADPLFRIEAKVGGALFHHLVLSIQPGSKGPYWLKHH